VIGKMMSSFEMNGEAEVSVGIPVAASVKKAAMNGSSTRRRTRRTATSDELGAVQEVLANENPPVIQKSRFSSFLGGKTRSRRTATSDELKQIQATIAVEAVAPGKDASLQEGTAFNRFLRSASKTRTRKTATADELTSIQAALAMESVAGKPVPAKQRDDVITSGTRIPTPVDMPGSEPKVSRRERARAWVRSVGSSMRTSKAHLPAARVGKAQAQGMA